MAAAPDPSGFRVAAMRGFRKGPLGVSRPRRIWVLVIASARLSKVWCGYRGPPTPTTRIHGHHRYPAQEWCDDSQRADRDEPAGHLHPKLPAAAVLMPRDISISSAPRAPRALDDHGEHDDHHGRPPEQHMQLQETVLERLPNRDAGPEYSQADSEVVAEVFGQDHDVDTVSRVTVAFQRQTASTPTPKNSAACFVVQSSSAIRCALAKTMSSNARVVSAYPRGGSFCRRLPSQFQAGPQPPSSIGASGPSPGGQHGSTLQHRRRWSGRERRHSAPAEMVGR